MRSKRGSAIRGIIRSKKAAESAIKGGISSIRFPNEEHITKCKENARKMQGKCKENARKIRMA